MKWMIGAMTSMIGLLWVGVAHAQLPPARIAYDHEADRLILDSLRIAFGRDKTIPAQIELQALRALSHYPELGDVAVEFVFCVQQTAHSSQPVIGSMLHGAKRRRYQVRISTEVPDFYNAGMHTNLPYNAQIGVLGHELGHTVQYLQRGFLGLLCEGIRYGTSRKYVIHTEHHTDQLAIDHQLGWQLLAWARIAHPLLEQAGRGQNYMLPEEITVQLRQP
jgi:hypothetical protein